MSCSRYLFQAVETNSREIEDNPNEKGIPTRYAFLRSEFSSPRDDSCKSLTANRGKKAKAWFCLFRVDNYNLPIPVFSNKERRKSQRLYFCAREHYQSIIALLKNCEKKTKSKNFFQNPLDKRGNCAIIELTKGKNTSNFPRYNQCPKGTLTRFPSHYRTSCFDFRLRKCAQGISMQG